jgi:hypothetical protein
MIPYSMIAMKKPRRKMRKGGGRAKGNSFERVVAKIVVATFKDHGITEEDCYRTPSSGGHRYAKKQDPGDLVISQKLRALFPFHVECKFYREIPLHQFFDGQKNWNKSWIVKKWLLQVTKEASEELTPMLVFKANDREILVCLPAVYPLIVGIHPRLSFNYNGEKWYVARFDRLLRALAKQHKGKDYDYGD